MIILPDLRIVRVGFYPTLFPKKYGSVSARLAPVHMVALEAEAVPSILVVNLLRVDVAQELCQPLTFPAAGFSLAASAYFSVQSCPLASPGVPFACPP